MIFITDELGKFEKNIIELAENMGFKECKTIEAIDLFCGISEKNDVLKEKDRYYAFIDIPQYWSVRADGLNGAIYDNKTKKANIYFKNPIEKRMVSRVEWIDRNNTVYRIDYYNKYGYMYCSENVSGGNVTVREFYDRNGDIKVVENLRNAAYLHDIGKIGVPDTILNKPTRLTDEEFAAIKSHTVMGADILKDITLLDHLVDIARNHHERYDGKGYPDGLVGEEIPLSARIVCVADSYDAMRSRRIYRNALPDEEIRRELLDNCSTQFDPQISRMFVDMLDNGMVVIDEDNPAAQGYRDNAAIESVADKFISEVMKTMSSQEKADSVDYLTGLYMRSRGQQVIAALMQDNDGCLAFIDMDNLKKVNDVHGHKAGDRALKLIGNLLAKETENETFAACRLGGDEFLIFMPYSDRASVESVIKRIFEGFESAREADCEIKEAALSAGLCMTTKGAMFESDYTKADKALYYVKQNCKGSYFFYEQLLADNKENTNLSADLRNVAKLLKESGSYTGALDLNYREFARIYEFVNNVGDRHNHNCYLVMVTMNTLPEQLADIEEIEKALDCMEQSIRSKIRKVDVCTRYSSMQYLIILFEPQENQIPNVMERIFMHYYELCDRENFKPQYEYIKMTEVK